ncbi:ABC transporter substrate-binding protein [Caenimonas soli]|uniref:ABC transporter substrate-binding protein n=1 Tax=Caenimonas soli TaxID=2735555 RepID=UPI001F2A81D9|nr:ABC transporter substrate-binding protein [Caenimonas soli]
MKRLLVSIAASTALACSLSANAGKADNSLNVALGIGVNVTTLDNYREPDRGGLMLARLIYDCLLSKDQATNQFKPELASSYKIVDDKTIDFDIRKGVKFHDGTALTAEDVVYTLNLVSSKDYNARYQVAVDWIEKAEKTGDYSVRLHMKRPFAAALEMLAGNLPIYPKAYYSKVGAEGMAVKPIGTGPYKATEVVPGTSMKFERFADYYDGSPKGKPSIATINVRILPEANTQYAELASGRLDWIWRMPVDAAEKLKRLPNVVVDSTPIMRFEYIAFNPAFNDRKSPVADVNVRKAISMAINREPIRGAFYGSGAALLRAACSPAQFGCAKDVTTYPYDPKAARELLAKAGYPNGVTVEATSILPNPAVNAAIAASFKESGVNLKIAVATYSSALSDWRAGKLQMLIATWGSYGIGDVSLSTSQFFSGNADDPFKDPKVIPLLKAADSSTNRSDREAKYRTALQQIAEQAYWVPLWSYSIYSAHHKDLQVTINPDEFVQFQAARWK